jgi:hypothetical protein
VNLEEKRIWLFGVVNGCPLNSPCKNCPFEVMRIEPLTERWRYLCDLTDNEVEDLVNYHVRCLFERELKQFKGVS